MEKPRQPEADFVSLLIKIRIRNDYRMSQAARRGVYRVFNEECNKKRPQEKPRQPEDDFVSLSIKN